MYVYKRGMYGRIILSAVAVVSILRGLGSVTEWVGSHQSVGILDEQHGRHAVNDGQRVEFFQHPTRAVRVALFGESERIQGAT